MSKRSIGHLFNTEAREGKEARGGEALVPEKGFNKGSAGAFASEYDQTGGAGQRMADVINELDAEINGTELAEGAEERRRERKTIQLAREREKDGNFFCLLPPLIRILITVLIPHGTTILTRVRVSVSVCVCASVFVR